MSPFSLDFFVLVKSVVWCKCHAPLNTDTPLVQTLSMAHSVSLLTGFDCASKLSQMKYKSIKTTKASNKAQKNKLRKE